MKDDMPDLDLAPAPGASIKTMTCNHFVLETYADVMEKRAEASGPLDLLEFQMYRDFDPDPASPKRELYRCSIIAGAIVEVHEITLAIWEKDREAMIEQYKQMRDNPPPPGVQIYGLSI